MQKIAIIEDDAILRDILANKLSQEGYQVITSGDGAEAIALITKETPDLILLDLLLPTKNGIEILTELQQNPILKNIPVIALSNSGEASEIEKVKAFGVRDFLIKAIFDSGDVVKRVQAIIGSGASTAKAETPSVPTTETPKVTPFQMHPEEPAGVTVGSTTNATGKHIVLIVEDDKFLRELAGQKLEREGFMVTMASSGKDALDVMKATKPDVIILDLILPGMDGYEVLKAVREDSNLKNIPVIILSNMGQEDDIEKAKSLGATDYLVKAHFSFGEIIKKIREVLGNVK